MNELDDKWNVVQLVQSYDSGSIWSKMSNDVLRFVFYCFLQRIEVPRDALIVEYNVL